MALVRKAPPALRVLYGEEEKEPTFPTMNDPEIIEFYHDIITHGVYTALNKPRGKYNVRAHELISNYSNLFFPLQQTEECPYITVSEMFFYKNFTEWTEFLKAAGEFFVTANTIIDKLIPDVTLNKDDINHVLALTGLLSTVLPNTARSEMPKLMRTISGYESGLLQEGGARSSSKAGFFDIKGGPHYVQRGGAWNLGDTNNEAVRNEIKAEIRRRLSAHTPPLTEEQISGTCNRANTPVGAAEMRASMLADDRGERASGGAGAPVNLNFVVSDAGPASTRSIAGILDKIKTSMLADNEEMKKIILILTLDNIEDFKSLRQYKKLSPISKKYLEAIIPWLIRSIKVSHNSVIDRSDNVEFVRVARDETTIGSILKWVSRAGVAAMTVGVAGIVGDELEFAKGAEEQASWTLWGQAFFSQVASVKYNQQQNGFLALASVEGSIEGYSRGLVTLKNTLPILASVGAVCVFGSTLMTYAFDDSPKEANFIKQKNSIKTIAKKQLNLLLSSQLEICIKSLDKKMEIILENIKAAITGGNGVQVRKGLVYGKVEFNRIENINPTSLEAGIKKIITEDIEKLLREPTIVAALDTVWPNRTVGTIMAKQTEDVIASIILTIDKLERNTAKKAENYIKKADKNSKSMMDAITEASRVASTYIGSIHTSVAAVVKENKAIALTGAGIAAELAAMAAGIPVPGAGFAMVKAFGAAAGTSTAGVNALAPTVKNFSSARTSAAAAAAGANLAAIKQQTNIVMAQAALAEAEARLARAVAPAPAAAPGFSAAAPGFSAAPPLGFAAAPLGFAAPPPPSGFPPPNATATGGPGRGGRRHKTAHRSSRPTKKTTRKANKTHRSPMPV